jgi:hypothetical protein
MRRLLSILAIAAALASPALAAKKPKKANAPKLQVFLLVSPLGFVQRGQQVQVRIRAYDPLHELSCPAWSIDCNDGHGHISSGLSDCEDPFPPAEDRPLVYRLPERGPVMCGPYGMPGDYAVRGILTDGTHGRGQATSEIVTVGIVQVTGPPAPPAQVAEVR